MMARSDRRLWVVQVLVLASVAVLGARLAMLQLYSGERFAAAAADNRIREVVTPAPRGFILDSTGRPMVSNEVSLVVSVDRAELRRQDDRGKAMLARLAKLLRKPVADIEGRTKICGTPAAPPPPRCWNGSPYAPVPLLRDADPRIGLQILERQEEFPGVTAELAAVRAYPAPHGVNGAHLLGYLGPITEAELEATPEGQPKPQQTDLVGRAGLERQYDDHLRGRVGSRSVKVDASGTVVGTVAEVPAQVGNHLVTSIDARLQAKVEQELKAAILRARTSGDPNKGGRRYAADSGAAVVLDVQTGSVLAMASYPTYDPSVWVAGISNRDYRQLTSEEANLPLISRAIAGTFAPASTFKVVTLPAAVQDGGYDVRGTYDCPGTYSIPGRTITNYESRGYGSIDLARAMEVSCDTIFYRWAYAMWLRDGGEAGGGPNARGGADAMVRMAQAYGLGRKTGIDLPEEASGRIADRAWKQRYWEATKEANCRVAQTGHPELEKTDRERAAYLKLLAHENCVEGFKYRAGDAVNFSIGQGDTTTTPLQIARVYAAIANDGKMMVPQVAKGVISPDGEPLTRFEPKSDGRLPLKPEVLKFLQDSLRTTTEKGTGAGPFKRAKFPLEQIPVASKTGTGEVYGKQTTSWFASYAPADKPRYAVVMMISQGGTGSGTSGPGVAEIYKTLFGVDAEGKVDPAKALNLDGASPLPGLVDVPLEPVDTPSPADSPAPDGRTGVTPPSRRDADPP